MKLYIGNKKYSSWSLRPWLVMKHFEIPFTEQMIALDMPDTNRNILAVSPSGRVPTLDDDGLMIWDSLAIAEYLAEKFADRGLWPANARARARARSIANEMHSGFASLRHHCPMKVCESFPEFKPSEEACRDIKRVDEIWRDTLGTGAGPHLFGKFSIADAMYAPVVFRVKSYNLPVSTASRDYCSRMLEHPGMKEWLAGAELEQLEMKRYM